MWGHPDSCNWRANLFFKGTEELECPASFASVDARTCRTGRPFCPLPLRTARGSIRRRGQGRPWPSDAATALPSAPGRCGRRGARLGLPDPRLRRAGAPARRAWLQRHRRFRKSVTLRPRLMPKYARASEQGQRDCRSCVLPLWRHTGPYQLPSRPPRREDGPIGRLQRRPGSS